MTDGPLPIDRLEIRRRRRHLDARKEAVICLGTYVMHFAASGEEALDRLAEQIQPALVAVLLDINMPDMDGLQLLGEFKQRCPDLPVLMVTGYGDDERRRHARGLGAFDFITKPVDFGHLKAQLRQLPGAAHW